MSKENRENYVLQRVLKVLSNFVNEKGLSYQEMSDMAKSQLGVKISPYQIRSVSNGKFQEAKIIPTLDSYIDVVLKILGMTDVDFLNRAVAYINSNMADGAEVKRYEYMESELREFVENPKNIPYVRFAYKLYKTKKEEAELEKIKAELK